MKISDELLQYCIQDGFRGDAMRSSVSDMILNMAREIKECRDATKTKEEWPDKKHETHKSIRSSDSSMYDL